MKRGREGRGLGSVSRSKGGLGSNKRGKGKLAFFMKILTL
jgi:hypothetical protein